MRIDFDPAKSERNRKERGLPLNRAADFDFAHALLAADERKDYGEVRYVALGLLDGRLHVLCFTETQEGIRVISLRKANAREVARYGRSKATD
ncbi:MAG TPA: BrnT family toxin [Rubrivivax sp.]|nr:BrnT family toxin [Rhodoferax sp.]MCP5288479.1 BrnT family toxin [Burkholderiaceae bacterium]HMR70782.1 BrnT family toxin [Rubrivivax sp.]